MEKKMNMAVVELLKHTNFAQEDTCYFSTERNETFLFHILYTVLLMEYQCKIIQSFFLLIIKCFYDTST